MAKLSVERTLRKARSHKRNGQMEEARKCYNSILELFPGNIRAKQGLAELYQPKPDTIAGKNPSGETLNQLIALYNKGQIATVIQECDRLTKEFPQSFLLWNLVGAANNAQGKSDEAIAAYNKALLIKPDYAEAYNNKGVALQTQGKSDAAIAAFNKALLIKPDYAEAYNNKGIALQTQGKYDEAIAAYNKALLIKHDYAEAYYNMGNALKDQGKPDEAIAAFNKALIIKPDYAEAYNNKGVALQTQGKSDEAIAAYNKALLIKPDYAEAYNNMGNALKDQGKPDEAIAAFNKALLIKHDFAEAHYNLSSLKKYEHSDPQVVQMGRLYADTNISNEDRCYLCFALAKSSEDLGNLAEAFRYFNEGNALRKKNLAYNIAQDEEKYSKIKETANSFKTFSISASGEENIPIPILIVGMPRSGTTLVEQIISNHSKVTAAGELNFIKMFGSSLAEGKVEISGIKLRTARNQYLNEIKKLSAGRPFVTDKMPNNFFYIGLIRSALPEAKIVHVKRSPAATCWSNFKHRFASKGLGYCYDLLDVVHYYQMYEDLMLFWDEHYPENIYHLDYEQLTTDQEPATQKLIQYLGIDWEDSCLFPEENKRYVNTASNLQVRKKVFKGSSEEWKRYEEFLDGALDPLINV